ncbi:MAG: pyridoxal 5'-phosphate synthase glutaminase subunit PdxT, partial [Halobacteriaceae archaeon]
MSITAGIIAVQGDVSEHADAIRAAASHHGKDVAVHEIRRSGLVPRCD